MSKLLAIIKSLFRAKPKRPLTSDEKQAIDEQIIIIDSITRGD